MLRWLRRHALLGLISCALGHAVAAAAQGVAAPFTDASAAFQSGD
jgi:hypothetical protein